eukprot:7026569-Alexandrium_andersonii.AAC.1
MMKLHRTTGHRPRRAAVRTPRRRGATPATSAAVKQRKCDSRCESRLPPPRTASTFEQKQNRWEEVGMDLK